MTSYSFGDSSAALMDGTGATSAATGPYDSSRAYRRDSGIAGTCDYQHSGPSPDAAGAISTGEDSFADYLFRQQQPQQSTSSSSDISSVVAAVAAAAHTSASNCGASGISIFHQDSPLLHSSSAYAPRTSFGSYSAHRYQEAVMSNNQSPSAATVALPSASMPALTATPSPNSVALGPLDTLGSTPSSTSSTASCLADPLPSFLSSLPTPMESSKYSSLVAGIASANNSSAILATAAPSAMTGPNSASNLLAAAAAAAAAVASSASATPVGAMSSGNPSSGSHANTSTGSYSHYSAQHQHSHNHGNGYTAHHGHHYSAAHNSAYDVSTLGLSHSSAISTSTPSLSAQVVAAAALAQGAGSTTGPTANALDLHSYSISAFSRPLNQSSPTSAAMITSEATSTLAANAASNSNSFAGISQVLTQQSAQYSQPPYQQQRSYSDYSAYYRSPSATMGLGTGSTTATGASPMSGTGMNAAASTGTSTGNTTQLAAAAAAAAAAMGSSYYASAAAYQPYMRSSVGGTSNAYYYAQPQNRYLPYSAYPPIRHFVSPARPFKCETCDQSFSRNHDLKRHVKIHSGVKPHKCPKCGKSFGRSDALKRHSMVKRCRSSTTSATTAKSTPAPPPVQVSAQGVSSQRMPQQLGSQRFESNPRVSIHPQLHHVQQQQQAHSMMQQGLGSSATMMTSVPSSSRLAPVSGSMFGQGGSGGGGGGASAMAMSASTNSIVSSMLSSRTNTI
ncbi:hypothetical protein GGI09_007560 [Coemansia sp. S100]|nr:hypothetical protein GGI09_007560 [Coemansia sp. S100]